MSYLKTPSFSTLLLRFTFYFQHSFSKYWGHTVSQERGFGFNEVPASRNSSFVYLGVPLSRHQLGATQHTVSQHASKLFLKAFSAHFWWHIQNSETTCFVINLLCRILLWLICSRTPVKSWKKAPKDCNKSWSMSWVEYHIFPWD